MSSVLPFPTLASVAAPSQGAAAPSARAGAGRSALLADLTRRIRCIERTQAPDGFLRPPREDGDGGGPPPSSPPSPSPSPSPPLALAAQRSRWTLGPAPLGDLSAPGGLDEGATYEIKPGLPAGAAPAADLATRWAAAQAFAAMLAIRRLDALARDPRAAGRAAPVLWCVPGALVGEIGRPYGHGLAALGLDPARLVLAVPPRPQEALWAAEEGLKSASLALVVLVAGEVALTPARRLALAARAHRTPCLLLTRPDGAAAASVLYRWRVTPAASAPHPFEGRAPGAPRLTLALERARNIALAAAEGAVHVLEWSHETRDFRLASALAARTAEPRLPGRRSV